jgi:hypothetical protein
VNRTRRHRTATAALACIAACVCALFGVPAHADIVQSPVGSTASVQVSVTLDNDWQFADAECLFIPLLVTYGRADDTSILGETTVTKVGSESVRNEGTFLVLPGDAVSGQLLDEIFVCPADGTGEYRLSTVIRAIGPASEDSVELDPLTFWVRPASSQISRVTAVSVHEGTRVRGRATAGDSIDKTAATGVVEIRFAKNRRWGAPYYATVTDGRFDQVVPQSIARGTRVKVTLTRCSWCSRASRTARVR